jgi:hypothetical protein
MAKEVDLLSYWMPVLRQIKEFKEIAKAEEPEIRAILEACDIALKNFFIPTADEQGISRFEEMLGIFPEEGVDLETRRLAILTKWANRDVYTDAWLYNKLLSLCGSKESFSFEPHYEEYAVDITVKLGVRGIVEVITSMLSEVLPCNLVQNLRHILEDQSTSRIFTGVAVSTAMGYQITNDINRKVSTVSEVNNGVVNSTATVITIISNEGTTRNTAVLGNAVLGSAVLGTK